MNTHQPLFDRAAQEARAPRFSRLAAQAEFLHARVAESLRERLLDAPRARPCAAILSERPEVYAQALAGLAGGEELVRLVPFPALAGPGAQVGDGAAALGPGRFDLIISGLQLHHDNDPVGQLVQMRLALKPDGLMLAALFGGTSLHELRAALLEAETEIAGGASPRVAPMGDMRELGALTQRAGFAMPVADVDRVEATYETAFALMRDLRAMGEANALTARSRRFTRRAVLLRAAEIYAARFGRPDGRIPATIEIVHLSGWAPAPGQPQPKRPGSAVARLADALGAQERPAGEKAGG